MTIIHAMLDPLMTREQLAEYLQVSPRQVDAMHTTSCRMDLINAAQN